MVDADGFRPNVGIILSNGSGQVLWARRVGQDAWQFPQGGIGKGESPEQALYRELEEEVGLTRDAVKVLGCTRGWLRYRLPKRYIREGQHPVCIGQKYDDFENLADCPVEQRFSSIQRLTQVDQGTRIARVQHE